MLRSRSRSRSLRGALWGTNRAAPGAPGAAQGKIRAQSALDCTEREAAVPAVVPTVVVRLQLLLVSTDVPAGVSANDYLPMPPALPPAAPSAILIAVLATAVPTHIPTGISTAAPTVAPCPGSVAVAGDDRLVLLVADARLALHLIGHRAYAMRYRSQCIHRKRIPQYIRHRRRHNQGVQRLRRGTAHASTAHRARPLGLVARIMSCRCRICGLAPHSASMADASKCAQDFTISRTFRLASWSFSVSAETGV